MLSNLPQGRLQFIDGNGVPLAGGSVAYFTPGTTQPVLTYQDDAATTANTNPIILDARGSCVAFGTGTFREYVSDSLGNLISDSIVVGQAGTTASDTLLSLGVSPAMLPVVEATTLAAAEALLNPSGGGTSTGHLALNPGDQTLSVSPTANPTAGTLLTTFSTLNLQATTNNPNNREFAMNLGLNSTNGQGVSLNNGDKVTLFVGATGQVGSGDLWTINPCLTMQAGSGSYNAQGIELDFNNNNVNRGASGLLSADLSAPIAYGLSVTGAGGFTSTAGVAVIGNANANPQWARGILVAGATKFCNYQDWSASPVGIQFDNVYSTAAINLTAVNGNAGGFTGTALFMKNSQNLSWQNADKTKVISDTLDANNNRVIGLGSTAGATSGIIMCAATIPLASGLGLGTAVNRWGDVLGTNFRMPNNSVLSWENTNDTGFIFDYTDVGNNRVVGGGNPNSIYMGANTSPITANLNLGSTVNYWGAIYSSTGVVTASDMRLKTNANVLPSTGSIIDAITPISYQWKDAARGTKHHFGFNADEVIANFADNTAAYEIDDDGFKWVRKDELIAVLWRELKDVRARLAALEGQA